MKNQILEVVKLAMMAVGCNILMPEISQLERMGLVLPGETLAPILIVATSLLPQLSATQTILNSTTLLLCHCQILAIKAFRNKISIGHLSLDLFVAIPISICIYISLVLIFKKAINMLASFEDKESTPKSLSVKKGES